MSECFICGAEVHPAKRDWSSFLHTEQTERCCGNVCRDILAAHRKPLRLSTGPSVTEERAALASQTENTDAHRWRLASAMVVAFPFIRIQRHQGGVEIVSAEYLGIGTVICEDTEEIASFIQRGCTPNCLLIDGKIVVCTPLMKGEGLIISFNASQSFLSAGRDSFLKSMFGCDRPDCNCSQRIRLCRVLPCPLSSLCHDGRCFLSCQRWECVSCGSYWPLSTFEGLSGETRCHQTYAQTLEVFYNGLGERKPLTKQHFEALKRLLSSISDAGIGPDHGLYSLTCVLFSDYFLALSVSMKGAGTQQAAAEKAVQWTKLFIRSIWAQGSSWRQLGWFVGEVIGQTVSVATRFPTLHSDTVHLCRVGIGCGFHSLFGHSHPAKLMLSLVSKSSLGATIESCEQWLDGFTDDPSELQRSWEDYLLAMTNRAMQGSQLSMGQLLGRLQQ